MADASYLLDFLKIVILSKRDEFHNCYRIILEIAKMVSINEVKPRPAKFHKIEKMFPRNQ